MTEGQPLPQESEGELVVSATESGAWDDVYRPAIGAWTEHGFVPRPPMKGVPDRRLRLDRHDGAVYVTGRKADVIVRGGVNVNAAELESVLGELPGVREIAIVGEHDERLGQRIVAS